MFGRKKEPKKLAFDPEKQKPVLRCSICNGEQVAGFKEKSTGKFQEVMLIADKEDLDTFCKMYGVDEVKKEY